MDWATIVTIVTIVKYMKKWKMMKVLWIINSTRFTYIKNNILKKVIISFKLIYYKKVLILINFKNKFLA